MSERLQTQHNTAATHDSPEDMPTIVDGYRELAARQSDGLTVQLLWATVRNQISIKLEDEHNGGPGLHFEVASADALDAFNHPYAYAPNQTQVSELHQQ